MEDYRIKDKSKAMVKVKGYQLSALKIYFNKQATHKVFFQES